MKNFIQLLQNLDETSSTNKKLEALVGFLAQAEESDRMWAIALLSGKRPKRAVRSGDLRQWCAEASKVPLWLMEETYHIVGDLAETLANLLPAPTRVEPLSLTEMMHFVVGLNDEPLEVRKQKILEKWDTLEVFPRFVFNKLLMGGFRVGVSQKLMSRAVSKFTGQDPSLVALRLMGNWLPDEYTWAKFINDDQQKADTSRPYPFCLAYAVEQQVADLGAPETYQAEWKWDGIRAQLIKREGKIFIWSRGEELVSQLFPEIEKSAHNLPYDGVWDGEILVIRQGEIGDFGDIQKRLGRKSVGVKLLQTYPVAFRAYDTLEFDHEDVRTKPQHFRSSLLSVVFPEDKDALLHYSPVISFSNWDELAAIREKSREIGAEGLMLKKKDAPYADGRKRGVWWKWKIDPYTFDAVLIYGMRGHGRRANLFTDYTFALWDASTENLVPVCKAYSGLTDAEIREVDAYIKKNTIERFGPVRSVEPKLVFEIAFEGIRASSRHKSGIAVRFPRIKRWRKDKTANEADSLETAMRLMI